MTILQNYPEVTLSLDFINYKTSDTKQCELTGLACDFYEFNENSGNYDADFDFYLLIHLASKQIDIDGMLLKKVNVIQ